MQDADSNTRCRHTEQKGSFRDILSIGTGEDAGCALLVLASLCWGSLLMLLS